MDLVMALLMGLLVHGVHRHREIEYPDSQPWNQYVDRYVRNDRFLA